MIKIYFTVLFLLLSTVLGEEHTARIYDGFLIKVPETNYVIINERAYHPENYILIDLTNSRLEIFNPSRGQRLIYKRPLTTEESNLAFNIFMEPSLMHFPLKGGQFGFDTWEITVRANILNQKRMINWGTTSNETINRISNFYKRLNQIPKKP